MIGGVQLSMSLTPLRGALISADLVVKIESYPFWQDLQD